MNAIALVFTRAWLQMFKEIVPELNLSTM